MAEQIDLVSHLRVDLLCHDDEVGTQRALVRMAFQKANRELATAIRDITGMDPRIVTQGVKR